MAQRKEVFSIYLEPHQAEELRGLARWSRVPMSAFIREAVDLVLARVRQARGEHESKRLGAGALEAGGVATNYDSSQDIPRGAAVNGGGS